MTRPLTTSSVAPFLFGSGLCSLVYQVGWLREFRLVFGASTSASAAVLAIFIGGLGFGSWLLGRRVDAVPRPLAFYAKLELTIAASAAVSPLLLSLVRSIYIAAGGTLALGMGAGTALRIVLAALVLAVPTIAMGGTLAAATRAIAGESDVRRRRLAILYGTNTLGAVVGALLATFFLLEVIGTRRTIWVAALVNALIAMLALRRAREAGDAQPGAGGAGESAAASGPGVPAALPLPVVLVASALAGFVFFLMEMTWYRMLGPILGGTVFTFGLILAIALLGIGVGGLMYALLGESRPATVRGLALTCLVEALGLAVAWSLGDRIAYMAGMARGASVLGFVGQIGAWAFVCSIVVLPAAISSGIQFPLLVNLLGRGRAGVGRELGLVYATNTIGAIAGSLLGGFVLLPTLGALGCWELATGILLLLGLAAAALGQRPHGRQGILPICALAGTVVLLMTTTGPTTVWRHSAIGAGRGELPATPAGAAANAAARRRQLVWQTDGVESSVALVASTGLAFVVNGKVDGGFQVDAATQMMGGLVGAALHPAPRRALVIGLGTGETAGWLADAPGIEHVDVVELEPAILEVARRGAAINRDVLHNPKVSIHIGDAREHLLVSSARYDLIFSEPSNPYRAGVSSLFTREFYAAARSRLAPGGLFLQWTQAYEVDGSTLATIFATLATAFPSTQAWRLAANDLLLVSSAEPVRIDVAQVAGAVDSEVIATALDFAWGVGGVEGFLAHYVGGQRLADEIAGRARGELNTDDRTLIEFAFARTLGQASGSNEESLRSIATELGDDRPEVVGTIDWDRYMELRAYVDANSRISMPLPETVPPASRARAASRAAYVAGNLGAALAAWRGQAEPPRSDGDRRLLGECLADAGDEAALVEAAALRAHHPVEADLITGTMYARRRQFDQAARAFVAGFTRLRATAMVDVSMVQRGLRAARQVGIAAPLEAPRLVDVLLEPFSLYAAESTRVAALLPIADAAGDATLAKALETIEPDVPRSLPLLARRVALYRLLRHPRLAAAEEDLRVSLEEQPQPLMRDISDMKAADE